MDTRHGLLTQTRDYMLSGRLTRPGEHVLAAVSAGRDSCVMLHILHSLSRELDFCLSVAHFDHQLRPQSAAEQQFARELAAGYNLPFYGGGADVRNEAKGKSLEDAARRARYAFLRDTARTCGAAKIATAHHAQDQAETVLLHLLRGSGLEGLAAIAPAEGGVIRPLLSALPEQIEDYRVSHGLRFCLDESNADPRYLRNRLRLDLLPQMRALNPRLPQSLSATADICREDNALLATWAQVVLDGLWRQDSRSIEDGVFTLPPSLQRRVVRMAFKKASGEELTFAQTEAARALQEEQCMCGPGGWLIYRRGALFIGREQPPLPVYAESIPPVADGAWHMLAGWGWEYLAHYDVCPPGGAPPGGHKITLPADMAKHLRFRTRQAGDAVPSSGRAGRRKIKDIFIDAKIPPYLRAGWPLLMAGDGILWLPGLYKRACKPEKPGLTIVARRIAAEARATEQ